MNFFTKTLNNLFKSGNQQELNKIKPIIAKINDLEKSFLNFSIGDFAEKTNQLKKNIAEGRNLEEILPESLVRGVLVTSCLFLRNLHWEIALTYQQSP